jgi:segregation and condensation protein B
MTHHEAILESILFVSPRPLTQKKLAEITGFPIDAVADALNALIEKYRANPCGIQINHIGHSYQMVTSPTSAKVVQAFLEEEEKKELTKPSLETLTIIAYRGPVTKAELEVIRGVNCSLILRNLLIRGLIEAIDDASMMTTRYHITFDFLHYLGIRDVKELPDFERLNSDENLRRVLSELSQGDGETPATNETPPS